MALGKKRREDSAEAPDTPGKDAQANADTSVDNAVSNENQVNAEDAGGFTPLSDGSYLDESDPSKQKLVYDKVSAEDMKREMERKRELRAKRRKEREARRSPVFSVARIGITAVTLLGAVGSLLYVAGTAGSFDEQYRANAEKLGELSSQKEGLDKDTRKDLQPSVISHDLALARERGQMITDTQNEMAKTRSEMNFDETTRDKNLQEYALQVDKMRELIAKESSSGGDFAPQQRWIYPMTLKRDIQEKPEEDIGSMTQNLPAEEYTWTMHDTLSIDTERNVVPVIWTAHRVGKEDNGQLIAWTKALFDPNTGMFSAFDFGLTPYGESLQKGTPSRDRQDEIADEETLNEVERELERARGLAEEQNRKAAEVDVNEAKKQKEQQQEEQQDKTDEADKTDKTDKAEKAENKDSDAENKDGDAAQGAKETD